MLVLASDQGKREFCIALYNRELHAASMCPGNHQVDYAHGWFYLDDNQPEQRPELTAEADEIMASGSHAVWYSSGFNTFLLGDNPNRQPEDEYFDE